ncbi:EAL domain-containing protein [Bacterioplanoides sp.]|uniref:bifunctional diguanylate cyclase/phosphodiesterase n=1 Tax=Bacterioplanoides sp. TaxID=2066072 RepID=UPI003B5BB28B
MKSNQPSIELWQNTWNKLVATEACDDRQQVTPIAEDQNLLPLDQLLERCIKVFLTTRSEVLESDLSIAVSQLSMQLGADYGLLLICPEQKQGQPLAIPGGTYLPTDLQRNIRSLVGNADQWCQLVSERLVKVIDRQSDIDHREQFLLNAMAADTVIMVPIMGRTDAGGCLFFSVSERRAISDSEASLLSTFAQLFFLVLDRSRMVDRLERREQLLERTERLANIGSWSDDVLNNCITFTKHAAEIFEIDPDIQKITLDDYFQFVHPEDKDRVARVLQHSVESGEPSDMIYRIITAQGNEKYIHGLGEVLQDDQGKTIARSGSVQDISEQQAKERRLNQSVVVFESTMEGIVITDARSCIEAVNPAFCQITGYKEEEIIGRPISILKSGQYGSDFYRSMYQAIEDQGYWRGEIWNRKKTGEIFPEWLTITAVRDGNNRVSHYVGVFSDMSKIKESEQQLEHLSYYDSITNLPNRALLLSRLENALEKARTSQRKVGLIAIDLDHFKHINDSLGHPAGDRLLQEFAHRLRRRLRDSDTVARLGGDDFMVVLEDVVSSEQVQSVSAIIKGLLEQPFDAGVGQELYISVSMGITLFPDHGSSVTQLLSNADVAVFKAKQEGRNRHQFYTNDMTQAASDRLELGNQLRKALQREDELQLYYQPQVCLQTGQLIGAEALMRWHHPTEGIIPPGRFLPVAEDNGLMPELDAWALRSACSTLARWQSAGNQPISVAVNITQPTFVAGGLVELLQRLLNEFSIDASWLELEITEGALLEPTPQVLDTIAGLKSLGISLAIDDFGTGYSSLAYLHRYQVDKLKIDRSFVNSIEEDDEGRVITTTIISLAKGLGLKVLAEGVETESQLVFLRDNQCESYQGFYFSRPVPVVQMEELMGQ